jgi:hypothetical protein
MECGFLSLIGLDIEGIDAVQKVLSQVDSPRVASAVTKDVAHYMRGQMRKYPPQQYVSRTRAYGKPFKTARQRRWFFAALRRGEITVPYVRTMRLQRAWKVMAFGTTGHLLTNDMPYAKYVQQSPQDRMFTLRQWRSVERVVHENRGAIQRTADESLSRALKKIRG